LDQRLTNPSGNATVFTAEQACSLGCLNDNLMATARDLTAGRLGVFRRFAG
jgi:hypothetical protein